MNTHYAVVVFGGDFDNDHPDPDLRGKGPGMEIIACGPFDFCWGSAAAWTQAHPLRRDEQVEVLQRDPSLVSDGVTRAETFRKGLGA